MARSENMSSRQGAMRIDVDTQQCIVLKRYVSYVLRRVHALAGCISGLSFSMQAACQYGVSAMWRGAASDSDLLESTASDILSDSFTYAGVCARRRRLSRDRGNCRCSNSTREFFIPVIYTRTYDEPSYVTAMRKRRLEIR